jgi:general secretion pathway protein H
MTWRGERKTVTGGSQLAPNAPPAPAAGHPAFDEAGAAGPRAGIRSPSSGFTLIEILAVIALIAVAVTVTAFSLHGLDRGNLQAAGREVAADLRNTRTVAMVSHRAQWFTVDLRAGTFTAPRRDPRHFPTGTAVHVTSAAEDATAAGVARIRFFPDGSSTGGNIVLDLGGHNVRVDVDWLTGAVTVRDGASR